MSYVPNYFAPRRTAIWPDGLERAEQSLTMPLPMVYETVKRERARWEYNVISVSPTDDAPLTDSRLAELGAEGWLLAGVQELPVSQSSRRVFYYFVRQAE
ncbi:MAG TPA: hypothetical protein VMV29_15220 [Ktedonobacterales bacterium]|nr:hypothetical protein [Ktedonobacterales bacterium]